jgi:LmbE family N-acetylglucosaminyl deacetylase
LLAVFAHPDDEAFGTGGVLRQYSDTGVKTALVCATRGEAGEISDPALATPETLGQVREAELREACRILGIQDLSFLDYYDGTVAQADPDEATGRIVYHIRRLHPQVVVTFDAIGGYGHTDHMAVHQLTVAAFHRAGDPTCYPEQIAQSMQPYAPQKLYATAHPVGAMRKIRERMRALGFDYAPGGNAATIPVEQMGTPDDQITTVIALSRRAFEAKIAARLAHRTQTTDTSWVNTLPEEDLREWRGSEHFVLLYPEGAPGDGSEQDLFAGVQL